MAFKRTTCRHCRQKLTPERPGQIVHYECALDFVQAQEEKKARAEAKAVKRADVIDTRARKEKLKRIPDYIKEAQVAFNAYIRERDKNKPCVCCGQPLGSGDVGGSFDCGHYRSTGSASHLRFNEDNAHGQRKVCNRWGAGRAVDYRIGLVARIGVDRVEALESDNQPRKWLKEDLLHIRDTYRQKLKELKKTG